MAQTPAPLVWDFYRQVGQRSAVGGVIDYYDTSAQSLSMSAAGDFITVDGDDYLYPYIPNDLIDLDANRAVYNDILLHKYKLLSYDTDHTFVGSDGETHTIRLGWVSDYHMITVDGVKKELSDRFREDGRIGTAYAGMYGTATYHPPQGTFPEGTFQGFVFAKMQHELGHDCFGVVYVSITVPYSSYIGKLYLYWEALKNHDTYKPTITVKSVSLADQHTSIDHGHWEDAEWSGSAALDSVPYSYLDFDHPARGAWYGAAVLYKDSGPTGSGYPTDTLWLLRYEYEKRLDYFIMSGSYREQVDNPITQTNLSIINLGRSVFLSDASIFSPGARVELGFTAGNSSVYPIATSCIDEIGYDVLSDTVSISARNAIGYYLAQQTFDEDLVSEGNISGIVRGLLEYAGIPASKYSVQTVDEELAIGFSVGETVLSALQKIADHLSQFDAAMLSKLWRMVELPDGRIVCGYDDYVAGFLPNNEYVFDAYHDVFRYSVSRCADGAYTQVRLTGTDADGEALEPEFEDVPHNEAWNLGEHRIYHASVSDVTQDELARMARNDALLLADVGDVSSVSMNLQPQLVCGDYARMLFPDETAEAVGIVTEVTHRFGKSGFFTDFTADKAGGVWHIGNRVATHSLSINGAARKRRITDYFAQKKK